jgi:hypothetical protein
VICADHSGRKWSVWSHWLISSYMLFLRYFFCKDLMNSSKSRSEPILSFCGYFKEVMTHTIGIKIGILLPTHREQSLVSCIEINLFRRYQDLHESPQRYAPRTFLHQRTAIPKKALFIFLLCRGLADRFAPSPIFELPAPAHARVDLV